MAENKKYGATADSDVMQRLNVTMAGHRRERRGAPPSEKKGAPSETQRGKKHANR